MSAHTVLWEHIRGNQIAGVAFTRKHPIGEVIVDFFCPRVKMVIEIDTSGINGEAHKNQHLGQNVFLLSELLVIRLRAEEILESIDTVISTLIRYVNERLRESQSDHD